MTHFMYFEFIAWQFRNVHHWSGCF